MLSGECQNVNLMDKKLKPASSQASKSSKPEPTAGKFRFITQDLKEQQEIFSSVIEHSPSGMVMADAEGTIVLVNLEVQLLPLHRKRV